MLGRGARDKEHAMSQTFNAAVPWLASISARTRSILSATIAWCYRAAAEVVARPSRSTLCQHAAMPGRHGSLRRRTSSQRKLNSPGLSKEEAKFVFENGCQQLILGSGQMGNVHHRRKLRRILRKRVARSCCSRPLRQIKRSTTRMRRRSAFFMLPAESGRPRCGGMSKSPRAH